MRPAWHSWWRRRNTSFASISISKKWLKCHFWMLFSLLRFDFLMVDFKRQVTGESMFISFSLPINRVTWHLKSSSYWFYTEMFSFPLSTYRYWQHRVSRINKWRPLSSWHVCTSLGVELNLFFRFETITTTTMKILIGKSVQINFAAQRVVLINFLVKCTCNFVFSINFKL